MFQRAIRIKGRATSNVPGLLLFQPYSICFRNLFLELYYHILFSFTEKFYPARSYKRNVTGSLNIPLKQITRRSQNFNIVYGSFLPLLAYKL